MSKPYVFFINGMSCTSCSNAIESILKSSELIKFKSLTVDLTTPDPKRAVITLKDDNEAQHKTNWEIIKGIIDDSGFTCENYETPPEQEPILIATEQLAEIPSPQEPDALNKIIAFGQGLITSHWMLGALGCIAGIGLLILTIATGGLPLAAMIPLASISVLLTLVLGAQSYYDTWKKLTKSYTLTMDTLFTISTISVLAVSIASFFVPWLPMMFEAGLLIYGFRHIGIAIEETIKEKISYGRFQDRAPKQVKLYSQSVLQNVDLNQIKPEDILLINPGELIPVDGFCMEETSIYTTIITGAIKPRYFNSGEKILAGMRLAENAQPLRVRVSKSAKQSHLARLDESIEQSTLEKAPLEIKTAQILTYFIPTVIGLAVLSGIVIGIFFPPALAIQCAVSVLVSACPCTLGLIIPLAVKTGIHKAADNGVQFKNARTLQEAEQIDTLIFDLNGTLTTGVPVVKQYRKFDSSGLSREQFLSLCATLEEGASHPIGKAIHSFAKQNNAQQFSISKSVEIHHSGISRHIDNQNYIIGSGALMQKHGISTSSIEQQLDLAAGDSLVFVARDQELIGYLIMTDPLRKDAAQTIKALIEMNKEIHLCTGADSATANRYAKALGIKHVYAECLATSMQKGDKSKTEYINLLRKKGHKVCMVGDAANDANALAASDMGIAVLSQGSDELTQQHAGAIIHNGTLLPIVSAFEISRQTVTNIKQNLIMSLGYNIAAVLVAGGLLVAAGFILNPAIGVALMAVQACIILLNVYRFKHQSLPHLEERLTTHKSALSSEQILNELSTHPKKTKSNDLEPSSKNNTSGDSELWTTIFAGCRPSQKAVTEEPASLSVSAPETSLAV